MNKLLIIAGGTGGHIFPALAVADQLVKQGVNIHWLGSKIGLEQQLVPDHYPITYISAKRLRGKGWKTYLLAPLQLLYVIWQAWRVIRRIKPDVVLAMGGFVSGPGGVAAKLAGKKLIIHEQNAVAGYSNRILSHIANARMSAYQGVFAKRLPTHLIGNPVRQSIVDAAQQVRNFTEGKLKILVLGGSQGAHGLNEKILNFVASFPRNPELEWWHQSGKNDYNLVLETHRSLKSTAKVEPFIQEMVGAYQWADLIICRAGALTLAEITCMELPSILVPFPAAVDDHQWKNSLNLQAANAALLVREKALNTSQLSQWINAFLENKGLLAEMGAHAQQLAKPEAAEMAAKIILDLLENKD